MRRLLKWAALVVLAIAAGGLLVFLYVMPPFFTTPPEVFSAAMRDIVPSLSGIGDPLERLLAERGRDIVVRSGCIGCHAANGARGPDYTKYLAGGGLKVVSAGGTFVSRNLTPDPDTGLARRTDGEVKRVLRSGVFPDGHVAPAGAMPWGTFSNWTEEDRHAVVVFLRHIPPVRQRIPEPLPASASFEPDVVERDYAFKDYSLP